MYQIKQKPEDFIVNEIPLYELDEKGIYSYFWLKKTDYNTMDAIKKIASRLNIPLKMIGFAGTKDRRAITKQVISIKNVQKEKIENLKLKDIELEYIGNRSKPISLGDLKGNEFIITVRNLETKKIDIPQKFPNYFGPQRFSKSNVEIGRALVKKDFKKAVELIDQQEVKEYIEQKPGDLVGALRTLPLKTRKIFVHAYQSMLWNKTVEEYIKQNSDKNMKMPIIGFGTDIESMDSKLKEIILDIMDKEEISERDFIIPQIKELSSQGGERDLFVMPENMKIGITEDELNENKFKAKVSFSLPKGSYATVVIEQMTS